MGKNVIKNWEKDLPGLSDAGVRERWEMARDAERASLQRGMGRNPKAARMWREKLRAAEDELERRGLRP